ncbi:MAG TPA: FecR family protein [Hanamia sp.]|nr:FecR family protein [Hanamia sp.]
MITDEFKNMDEKASRVAYLIAGYIRNTLTESEHDELDKWVEVSDKNMLLFEELTDEKNIQANLAWMDQVSIEERLKSTKENIKFGQKLKRPVFKRWYSIAAVLAIVAGSVIIIVLLISKHQQIPASAMVASNDIEPGGDKATLTLSNGRKIDLSQLQQGQIAGDNGVNINKTKEGEIVYSENGLANNKIQLNVLTIPRGGQYKVQLSDGTLIWLNASSSLTYPASFSGKERNVTLTGEAYFEIAKDKNRPFKVLLTDSTEIHDIGTHFNIMAYDDENGKYITLTEGEIDVRKNNEFQKLKPGQQVRITGNEIEQPVNVDTSDVIGWKNGQFIFHNADITSIMRKVARWYDVDINYETNFSQHFNAIISRKEPVSRLLHLLEETGQIHFKIENKKIYVLQ